MKLGLGLDLVETAVGTVPGLWWEIEQDWPGLPGAGWAWNPSGQDWGMPWE